MRRVGWWTEQQSKSNTSDKAFYGRVTDDGKPQDFDVRQKLETLQNFLDLENLEVFTDGSYFIDRNPVYFLKVVDFFRNNRFISEFDSRETEQMFYLEPELWGIDISVFKLKRFSALSLLYIC